ncbi:FG-GAP repeat domain-containing protein [Spirosoma endophyticum]|uniref:Repeat domain-containing protein n=1 Tax=Spirosoma endophyticum TaxID=662367 RepID=A0A1I2HGW8_9BACT|nr:VCBS repeat-containing protein [Spirosoma endophyticum]SFF28550.1 Repeat domain-containing protein [Spirosoma endophyticum]
MKKTVSVLLFLSVISVKAQITNPFSFHYDQTPPVQIEGRQLTNPWAGGLNAPQYSTLRLNTDTRDDLAVFDRTTGKVSTFIATDSPTGSGIVWQYAPEYETTFPAHLNAWMLLVDYDGDDRADLFTSASGGVRVFHNEGTNGKTVFTPVADPLLSEGFTSRNPLFIYSTDMPAIVDYDGDGDIDIITFDSSGNSIAYHQNMSVERTGLPSGLDFKRYPNLCWGHFQKEYCNDFTFGFVCGDGSGRLGNQRSMNMPSGGRPLHTGNTITMLDTDGDGKKDMLFGFVSCENVARLRNTGTNDVNANFTSYDSLFPARSPILFPAFPATFWADVDGDGVKDLLASPNVSANANGVFDFQASSWLYKNTGSNQKPDFQLIQKDFLQADMLDLGERAAPALADLDGDGDLDLLVGFAGSGTGTSRRASLWHFENTGTTQRPAFRLVTTDYLGMGQSLQLTHPVPSFADLDNNGSLDLVVMGVSTSEVEVRVWVNTAPLGRGVQLNLSSAIRWPTRDLLSPADLLTVSDVDRDGRADLLISNASLGTIQFYRNAGSATTPVFQLQNQTVGGFTRDDYGYAKARSLVVADVNGDQKNELLVAADNGTVRLYQYPDDINQSFVLLDSLPAIGKPGAAVRRQVKVDRCG